MAAGPDPEVDLGVIQQLNAKWQDSDVLLTWTASQNAFAIYSIIPLISKYTLANFSILLFDPNTDFQACGFHN